MGGDFMTMSFSGDLQGLSKGQKGRGQTIIFSDRIRSNVAKISSHIINGHLRFGNYVCGWMGRKACVHGKGRFVSGIFKTNPGEYNMSPLKLLSTSKSSR